MASETKVIHLNNGDRVFFSRVLASDEKNVSVESSSKEGRLAKVTIPVAAIAKIVEWEKTDE